MLKVVINVFVLLLVCQNVSMDQSLSDATDRLQGAIEAMIEDRVQKVINETMQQIMQENNQLKSEISELKEKVGKVHLHNSTMEFEPHNYTAVELLEQRLADVTETVNQTALQTDAKIQQVQNENNRLKSQIAALEVNNERSKNMTIELAENTTQSVSVLRGMSAQAVMLVHQVKNEQVQQFGNLQRQQEQQFGNLQRQQEQQISAIQSEVDSLRNEQEQQISAIQSEVDSLRSDMAQKVYFSVYMTEYTFRPSSGQTIPFKGVYVDSGNNFNSVTSKFRCPVSGVYYFTYTIYSDLIGSDHTHQYTRASLMVGGQEMAEVWVHNTHSDGFIRLQPSNSVITHCTAGTEVWLEGGGKMYGSSSDRYTTFSGFLVD